MGKKLVGKRAIAWIQEKSDKVGNERNLNALFMYRHIHTHNVCEKLLKGTLTIKINITSSLLEDTFGS